MRGVPDGNSGLVRRFYDRDYPFADDVERPNAGRLWHALRWLAPLEGTALLDLGCGAGAAARLALARGKVAQAIGVDFSQTALRLASRANTAWRGPCVSLACGDGMALPFADAAFDRAFAFGSMEHFPHVGAGFTELARVLRPSGRAVVVVPNFYVRTPQPLEHRNTRAGWTSLIEESGLVVEGIHVDRGPAILKNRHLARIALRIGLRLLGAVPGLEYQLVFVLRKPMGCGRTGPAGRRWGGTMWVL